MKPHILVVTSTFPRWQNDTDPPFVYELSRRLTDNYAVTVHTPHYPGAQTNEMMGDVSVHRFRYFFSPFEKLAGSIGVLTTLTEKKLYYGIVPFFLMAQFVSLLLLVRKVRPDVIHAHWIIPQGFIAVLVKIFTGVPVVVTAHGGDVFALQHWLFRKIKRFTLRRARVVSVVSNALATALAELVLTDGKIEIISMGVDSVLFSPSRADNGIKEEYGISGPFLLYVGKLTEQKGVQYLIDAMALVFAVTPIAKLLIVGSGEAEKELKNQVLSKGLSEQILFVGSVPNTELPSYYATADTFIGAPITTKRGVTEGFGLTFVEAGMSGCLLIGTDTGGVSEIIEDSVTGFLVPEKSSKALAERILFALKEDEKVKYLKQNARERCVEKFDWKIISQKYSVLFDRIVSHRDHPHL